MKPNPGKCPPEAKGKRVNVILANGNPSKTYSDIDPMLKPGWAADGKNGCRWSITGEPWDIAMYEVIGGREDQ